MKCLNYVRAGSISINCFHSSFLLLLIRNTITTSISNSPLVAQFLATVKSKPEQDPQQMMQPLDEWRKFLPAKMHVDGNTETDIYYLNLQAVSYRFECIMCRLMRRLWQQSQYADWSEWAKQRLRSAILELNTLP